MRTKWNINIHFLCISFIFILMLTACKRESKHNGFVLQRFNVVNNQLNSIIKGIKDSAQILKFGDDVILLVLRMNDSVPEFCFASTKKKDINEEYIYRENRRIVGYIVNKSLSTEIIVLSNLNSSVDFGMIFYKFLVPTVDKKCFDYIYFPDNQYTIDARGFGPTPPVFDPYYYFYTYKENRIIPEYFER